MRWADNDDFEVVNENTRQSSRPLELNAVYRFNIDGKIRVATVLGIGTCFAYNHF